MSRNSKFINCLVTSLLLVALSSCGGSDRYSSDSIDSSDASYSSETRQSQATADLPTQTNSAGFVAKLVGGATFDSSIVLAKQPLALWFWAPG